VEPQTGNPDPTLAVDDGHTRRRGPGPSGTLDPAGQATGDGQSRRRGTGRRPATTDPEQATATNPATPRPATTTMGARVSSSNWYNSIRTGKP
jgi:hypothetical protein